MASYHAASGYALTYLKDHLPSALTFHNLEYTVKIVLPAATRLGQAESVTETDLMLLRTAAMYHNLGLIRQFNDHKKVAAEIARSMLPSFGYTPAQIDQICGMIRATEVPQTPQNQLESILADADMAILGSQNFAEFNRKHYEEVIQMGQAVTWVDWCAQQAQFIERHRYFTESARSRYTEQKRINLTELKRIC